ncbi:MAG: hypothetical protein WCY48_10850 [Candidatus Caldatribacteriota bacterium]
MKKMVISTLFLLGTQSLFAGSPVELTPRNNHFHFIQKIGEVAPAINVEAYERELKYLQDGLSLEEKARTEANLLAEAIRLQVIKTYEAELENLGNSLEAYESIRSMIQRDLELADNEMRDELLKIAEGALLAMVNAPRSEELDLSKLENVLMNDIKMREAYLLSDPTPSEFQKNKTTKSINNNSSNFKSRKELVDALVSEDDNGRWYRTSSTIFKSGEAVSRASNISLQVKIEFLGVSVEAGPRISFSREFSTNVTIHAEGLEPVLDGAGRFIHYVKRNGKLTSQRRVIGFSCDASLKFSSSYEGRGGFKVAGVGVDNSFSKEYSNVVTLNSRRLQVPESVGRDVVNLHYLTQICHQSFLNARINNNITVKDSLNLMMKNVINGVRFSHPDTQCAIDSHCNKWFNTQVLPILRNKARPRCVQNNGGVFSCVIRGTQGQACTVIENGKRTSSGLGEYICDKGLRCVKVRNAGWFQGGRLYQPSVGVCR